jgi:hypothetical protein
VNGGGHPMFLSREGKPFITMLKRNFGKERAHRHGFYSQNNHVLQPAVAPAAIALRLPDTYNVTACTLAGVAAEDALYVKEVDEDEDTSDEEERGRVAPDTRDVKCALATSAFGQGTLVYLGDVNCEMYSLLVRIRKSLVEVALQQYQKCTPFSSSYPFSFQCVILFVTWDHRSLGFLIMLRILIVYELVYWHGHGSVLNVAQGILNVITTDRNPL